MKIAAGIPPRKSAGKVSGGDQKIDFEFTIHDNKDLKKLVPCDIPKGRFSVLLLGIARQISEMGKNKFVTINPGKNSDPRELKKIAVAATKFLNRNYRGFLFQWNALDNVFVLFKKQDG